MYIHRVGSDRHDGYTGMYNSCNQTLDTFYMLLIGVSRRTRDHSSLIRPEETGKRAEETHDHPQDADEPFQEHGCSKSSMSRCDCAILERAGHHTMKSDKIHRQSHC